MMPLWSRGVGLARVGLVAALLVSSGVLALAQKKDQKPEIETVIHAADAAMAAAPAANDIPVQIQSDFLKAQAGRVWIPLTLTIDAAKLQPGPLTLYLRVTPRGMTAPAPPAAEPAAAKDAKKKTDKNDKNKDPKAAAPASPSYPYEDVAVMDLKPAPAGQPFRILRGIGVPTGSYDLYVVVHERTPSGKLGVTKQGLDVPNFSGTELMTSSIILAERV